MFQTGPVSHGVIHHRPKTLLELHEFLSSVGFDLVSSLREQLKEDMLELDGTAKNVFQAPLVVVIRLPKRRDESGAVEATELAAFLTEKSTLEVGLALDAWINNEKELGMVIAPDPAKTGSEIAIRPLNSVHELSPSFAARLNGLDEDSEHRITSIGAGALGSQVTLNLARAGYGESWSIIDEDKLFPHNLSRHALNGESIGEWKAESLATFANSLFPSSHLFTGINANLITPRKNGSAVREALQDSTRILDMSASVAAARFLTHRSESTARKTSAFLSPLGSDVVFLDEGSKRKVLLDSLEMQYYRSVANDERLSGHLSTRRDGRTRYGQSCRDVTFQISQEQVALHSAVAARAVRASENKEDSSICIWRSSEDFKVEKIEPEVYPTIRFETNRWTVVMDTFLISKIAQLRESRLPNETGGVLIGSFDLEYRVVYLVDTIPSPEDSEEWPTLYIRGCKGLRKQIKAIGEKTNGFLSYAGEWHSHPDTCSTQPSNDDVKVFAWLTERMHGDGLPALMLIAGENESSSCYIGEISRDENLIPNLSHE